MKQQVLCSLTICLLLAALSMATADTITVVSGNAPIGERDPHVYVVGAPVTVGGISAPAADEPFQNALVKETYMDWTAPAPGSQWVGVAPYSSQDCKPGGYHYTTYFNLPEPCFSPRIWIVVGSDDTGAVYLNGNLLGSGTRYYSLRVFAADDPTWFSPGSNQLQFHVYNHYWESTGTPTGLTFSAEIEFEPIPEPSGIFTLVAGLGGLSLTIRRRKRATLKGASLLAVCLVTLLITGLAPVGAETLTTLWIPATSADGAWTPVLESGQEYKFVATGTYYFNAGRLEESDAEWSLVWGGTDWKEVFVHGTAENDVLDIVVDGISVDWLGSTDGVNWARHVFSPDHTYVYYYTGNGQPVHLWIADQTPYGGEYYYDNSGGLNVEIEVVPEPSSVLTLLCGLAGLGSMGWRRRK